jgi:hypothetical protein
VLNCWFLILTLFYFDLSVCSGYITPVPSEYNDLPQLQGRATVEMLLKKPDGESFDIEGSLSKEAKMKMIIDGYAGTRSQFFFLTIST